jgi:hypothetical protein
LFQRSSIIRFPCPMAHSGRITCGNTPIAGWSPIRTRDQIDVQSGPTRIGIPVAHTPFVALPANCSHVTLSAFALGRRISRGNAPHLFDGSDSAGSFIPILRPDVAHWRVCPCGVDPRVVGIRRSCPRMGSGVSPTADAKAPISERRVPNQEP